MEIDPHLRQLQEQAKLFSRYNSAPGTEPDQEVQEKEPRKLFEVSRLLVQIYITINKVYWKF